MFAAARRSPEEHGRNAIAFNLQAQRFAGAEKFFLADKFIEGAGTHAFGKGLLRAGNCRVAVALGFARIFRSCRGDSQIGEEAHRWVTETNSLAWCGQKFGCWRRLRSF